MFRESFFQTVSQAKETPLLFFGTFLFGIAFGGFGVFYVVLTFYQKINYFYHF